MKKIILAMCATVITNLALAQGTIDVVVQMPSGSNPSSVDVTGNFMVAAGLGTSDWSNGVNLTNTGSGWAGSINNVPAGTYELKFRTYDAGGAVTWEGVPSSCATNGNRSVTVTNGATATVGPVCFSSCGPCIANHPVNLTLTVDMNGVDRTIPNGCTQTDVINVAGNFGVDAGFTDWAPGAITLTESPAGSGLYTRTLVVLNKEYEFKFLRADGWNCTATTPTTQFSEQIANFSSELLCLNTSTGNRVINLTAFSSGANANVSYKWESCAPAGKLGISDVNIFGTSIAPNPFNGSTQIKFAQQNAVKAVHIYNSVGQLVQSFNNVVGDKVSVYNLNAGTYVAQIVGNNGAVSMLKLQSL